jgi:lipoprotein-anchoring transpeptidase ErfK/SrfK
MVPPAMADEPAPVPSPTAEAAPPANGSQLPLSQGATGARVREVQQRLAWLGYRISARDADSATMGASTVKAVKDYQNKFFLYPTGIVNRKVWSSLRHVSGQVGRLPAACLHEKTICVDKNQMLLRLVDAGKVQLTLDARFGLEGVRTREGAFRIQRKSRDHVSSRFGSSMPFALFFSGGQAVHYSPYFARYGYNGGSHGCIGIRDYERAAWLFDRTPVGTKIYVYWS